MHSKVYSRLLIVPLFVTNWKLLSCRSRLLNGFMKILRVDLQKAKDNIKNKIEGYPNVERENVSPFSFCKQF